MPITLSVSKGKQFVFSVKYPSFDPSINSGLRTDGLFIKLVQCKKSPTISFIMFSESSALSLIEESKGKGMNISFVLTLSQQRLSCVL